MANTETVEIIIEGTDNSASAFASAAGNTKALTNQAKDGAEGIQKLARIMGAGPIIDFASTIKESAESLQKMTAGMKGGGVAALGLKAGVAGLAVFGAFKFGQMFDEWVLGTRKWRQELEAAMSKAGKTADMLSNKRQEQFDLALAEIDIIENADAKRQAELALLAKVNSDLEEQKEKLKEVKAAHAELLATAASQTGNAAEALGISQQQLDIEQKRATALRDQQKTLERRTGDRADRMAEVKKVQNSQSFIEELKLREKLAGMTEVESAVFQARAKAHGDADKAEAERITRNLLSMEQSKKLSEDFAKSMQELGNAFEEAFSAQEDADWAVIENLKFAKVELEQGEDAAYRMSLSMQGLSQPAIEAAVALRQQNAALEEQKRVKDSILGDAESIAQRMIGDQESGKSAPSLSAKESRFLTRGTAGSDPAQKVAKNTEDMKKIAEKALEEAKANRKAAEELKQAINFAYEEVG